MSENQRPANRLLAALPQNEYDALSRHLEKFEMVYGANIYKPGSAIDYVYFPESGIISLLANVNSASSIEIGMVGDEGMTGLPVYLGVKTSVNLAVVQGKGSAQRLSAANFTEACTNGSKMNAIIQRFVYLLYLQISQSAACNRFHPIEERLARWLLMTQDRMHSNEFQITQEFLSNMLGVRREAVNKAANSLHHHELISYARGNMRINDRTGLEKAACPCYWIIKHEYETAAG
jgi:CRP-like cAMP-binding protein